ncbi:putative clathrin assembly protein At5g57200 isoform X3 [Phragmites australis]|uniref:putative clathrin assembly protein At5g57200 isoform X3 n=1 Tax=Phragmites australis TaxID=29695 RepID=UPI002D77F8E4|nr:putative clathrin assembly protein At5g57200 isoform X3 [Phragmites australis]
MRAPRRGSRAGRHVRATFTKRAPARACLLPLLSLSLSLSSLPSRAKLGTPGLAGRSSSPVRAALRRRAGMGSGTWRKAYGALKDSTKVGLANFNSEYKDLDIAIVKATNHVECPPKERHLRRILFATSANCPRADVAYSICTLARRLSKTKNWIVALKTLIVIHRLLREGDGTFRDDFLTYSYRGNILQIPQFQDDSSPLAWDCSAWVRTYALYLDERVECFRVLKYDVEADRLLKLPQASGKAEKLSTFYDHCKHLELARTFQFPTLRQPPPSFLVTMEEYIREAPRAANASKSLENEEQNQPSDNEKEDPQETEKPVEEEKQEPAEPEEEPQPAVEPAEEAVEPQPPTTTGDLLNLDEEVNPMIADLEERNALALAIVAPGNENKASTSRDFFAVDKSGWELALVTAPSNHSNQSVENKLAGGFDKLLLDSLYEDEARRQQIASVTYTGSLAANPFDPNDPFAPSNSFAPPSNVQLAMMEQQQHYYQAQQQQYFQVQHQQQMVLTPPHTYQQQFQYSAPSQAGLSNPFGDPFSSLVAMANPPKKSTSNLV